MVKSIPRHYHHFSGGSRAQCLALSAAQSLAAAKKQPQPGKKIELTA
jgi:hypothetical protein